MRPFDPRVLRSLPEARPVVAGLGVLGLAQGVIAIAQAFAVSALVVAVVRWGMPGAPDLPPALLGAAGVFAVRAGLGALAETYAARGGIRVSAGVRTRLLTRWLAVPEADRPASDDARVLATQGASSIEPYVARFLPALVGAAVLPVLVVATIAFIDWVSALVVVLTVPLLPVFAALIGRATQDRTQRRWRALTSLSGHFLDVVRGLPTLVTYGRAWRQAESIRTVSQAHRAATVRTLRIAFLSSAALELLATISVAIVAVSVGLRLAGGGMDLASGLTAILLAPEAYWPIRRVGTEYHSAADGAAALGAALDDLAALSPGGPGSAAKTRHANGYSPGVGVAGGEKTRHANGYSRGEGVGVGYTYPGATTPALADLELRLPQAGLVVVTGASGAGKSTLLELLAGLRRPTVGQLTPLDAHLVGQRPLLLAARLRDNLTLGIDVAPNDDALRQALVEVGLGPDLQAMPGGLDTMLGDDGFGLSAGQRARLALARATLSEHPAVLLDEPTAHLDPDSAATVHEVIERLARTRLVVAVTHRGELVARAAQVVAVGSPPPPEPT